MSNDVTDSAEALIKLNVKTGGLLFWLSAAEYQFIEDACGLVTAAGLITTAGPAASTDFTLEGPWTWEVVASVAIDVSVDGGGAVTATYVPVLGDTTGGVAQELARIISNITGASAQVSGGATINAKTVTVDTDGAATTITLSALTIT